ncbi:MAG TPA: Fe-S cluster assembly ATPase SufC [Acidimicrobiales bacterium]|nr:Fe-S cluster assembly ATPase SufC [Acidimicrobiales bacterium]
MDAPLATTQRAPGAGIGTAPLLAVEDLHATVEGAEILRGVDLVVGTGELHAIMGPNGSGKSTLANILLGSPAYSVTSGRVLLRGEDVTLLPPDARAKLGMFLAFQYPEEIPGVPIAQFLRQAAAARRGGEMSVLEIRVRLREWLERLGMDTTFGERHLNDGFSGGEKKRNEILQMALLEPDLAILDETDSGLDIDGLRTVARGVDAVRSARPELGVVVVTHYRRILDELSPDAIHVLVAGRIVESGGPELAERLEHDGYEGWQR